MKLRPVSITKGVLASEYMALGNEFARGDARRTISRSDLMFFGGDPHSTKTPAKWVQGAFGESTSSTEWGDLIDCLLLTPERFASQFVVAPGTYSTKGMQCPVCQTISDSAKCRKCKADRVETTVEKPWSRNADSCANWEAEQEAKGFTVIKANQLTEVEKAIKQFEEDPEAWEILRGSDRQVQCLVEYVDDETGIVVPIKTLVDILPIGANARKTSDLKTACDASYSAWQKKIHTFGYDMQAALYLDAVNVATDGERNEFVHIVQESDWPYEVVTWPMSEDYLQLGRGRYLNALRDYCQCLSRRNWPGLKRQAPFGYVEPPKYVAESFPAIAA